MDTEAFFKEFNLVDDAGPMASEYISGISVETYPSEDCIHFDIYVPQIASDNSPQASASKAEDPDIYPVASEAYYLETEKYITKNQMA